jgi:hypothetical protein
MDLSGVKKEWKQFWRIRVDSPEEEDVAATPLPYKAIMTK